MRIPRQDIINVKNIEYSLHSLLILFKNIRAGNMRRRGMITNISFQDTTKFPKKFSNYMGNLR